MLRKLSLVSGLSVLAVMLTPQAASTAALAPQSMLRATTAADSSLVANATYYRRYDDDRDYRYRNRTYEHRHYGYRHYRDTDMPSEPQTKNRDGRSHFTRLRLS